MQEFRPVCVKLREITCLSSAWIQQESSLIYHLFQLEHLQHQALQNLYWSPEHNAQGKFS